MAKQENKKKSRKQFLQVDPFQVYFGAISVVAVYDVFQRTFKIEKHKMKNYSFSHCVEELRKMQDPEYKTGDMAIGIEIEKEVEHVAVRSRD